MDAPPPAPGRTVRLVGGDTPGVLRLAALGRAWGADRRVLCEGPAAVAVDDDEDAPWRLARLTLLGCAVPDNLLRGAAGPLRELVLWRCTVRRGAAPLRTLLAAWLRGVTDALVCWNDTDPALGDLVELALALAACGGNRPPPRRVVWFGWARNSWCLLEALVRLHHRAPASRWWWFVRRTPPPGEGGGGNGWDAMPGCVGNWRRAVDAYGARVRTRLTLAFHYHNDPTTAGWTWAGWLRCDVELHLAPLVPVTRRPPAPLAVRRATVVVDLRDAEVAAAADGWLRGDCCDALDALLRPECGPAVLRLVRSGGPSPPSPLPRLPLPAGWIV